MDPLLTSSTPIQQALFEGGMPQLKRKSLQTFLAIKRCQRPKIEVVINLE
jgi:hypothetical protein